MEEYDIVFCTKNYVSAYVYSPPPPPSRARGLERFPSLKYNNVQKWESRFSFQLDATKRYASHSKMS